MSPCPPLDAPSLLVYHPACLGDFASMRDVPVFVLARLIIEPYTYFTVFLARGQDNFLAVANEEGIVRLYNTANRENPVLKGNNACGLIPQ